MDRFKLPQAERKWCEDCFDAQPATVELLAIDADGTFLDRKLLCRSHAEQLGFMVGNADKQIIED